MFFSIIIPVYNRPEELRELLTSLEFQNNKNFEVIVVEDGSKIKSDQLVQSFAGKLAISYLYQDNAGPGVARNSGFKVAKGYFFIVLDSDCILPETYLEEVLKGIDENKLDAFGGPDAAHHSFTNVQKAINYSMTSILSTGGIRGKKIHVGNYQARSFNMGISREVYLATNGFSNLRVSEDIELSIRINQLGFKLGLLSDAFVYHKRRSTWKDFFRQTYSFGKGRMHIVHLYPSQFKWVHTFPSLFSLFVFSMPFVALIYFKLFLSQVITLCLYLMLVLVHAYQESKSLQVSSLSIVAVLLQLFGYGLGFMSGLFRNKRHGS